MNLPQADASPTTTNTHGSDVLRVEMRPLAGLSPHPANYRRHPPEQLEVLRRSIRAHGVQKPVVIQHDGTILAGHGLVEAARLEGYDQIPVHVYTGAHPEAFLVADNYSAQLAVNDEPALAALLQRLAADEELAASGYGDDDLSGLIAKLEAEEAQRREETFDSERAMAEAQPHTGPTRVQSGELWQLGRHRLLCGDCTAPENWTRLLLGELAHTVITDPPYAVSYAGGRCADPDKMAGDVPARVDAYWDEMSGDDYGRLLVEFLQLAHRHSDDKAPLYLWFASVNIRHVHASLDASGWKERTLICWVKNIHAGNLFAQYKYKMEPCYYGHKVGQSPRWPGPTNEVNVWEHDKPLKNEGHPTIKPLPLIERSITNATEPGQLVVDPFLGSGTAVMAAERTGRRCVGFELDARYCDVILSRWEEFTGKEAVRIDE